MKVIVLTSINEGPASSCLPELIKHYGFELAGVIYSTEKGMNKSRVRKRQIIKVFRIGVLGALNGIRMRSWYHIENEPISIVCERWNVPLFVVDKMNGDETKNTIKRIAPDLGVSLGNGYLAPSVFQLPKHGMINVHTEILPDFQGAQGIIWPIYKGLSETGFTIHQIDRSIDTGRIIFQRKIAIQFMNKLSDTVRVANRNVWEQVPSALADVITNYHDAFSKGRDQEKGKAYTTPTIWAFIKICYSHYLLQKRASIKNG